MERFSCLTTKARIDFLPLFHQVTPDLAACAHTLCPPCRFERCGDPEHLAAVWEGQGLVIYFQWLIYSQLLVSTCHPLSAVSEWPMHPQSWMVPEHASSILLKLLAFPRGLLQHHRSLSSPQSWEPGLMDDLIPLDNTFNQRAMDADG